MADQAARNQAIKQATKHVRSGSMWLRPANQALATKTISKSTRSVPTVEKKRAA